jgi:hypothetical protein
MTQIFVSYSRVDTPVTKQIVDRLRRVYGLPNVWYDDELYGGQSWWKTILEQIRVCDVFVYLLSNESVTSQYCLAEFAEAIRLQKPIVTVQIRDKTRLSPELDKVQHVDMKRGLNDDNLARLIRSINELAARPKKRRALSSRPTVLPSVTDKESEDAAALTDVETPILTRPVAEVIEIETAVSPWGLISELNRVPIKVALLGILVVALLGGVILPLLIPLPQEVWVTFYYATELQDFYVGTSTQVGIIQRFNEIACPSNGEPGKNPLTDNPLGSRFCIEGYPRNSGRVTDALIQVNENEAQCTSVQEIDLTERLADGSGFWESGPPDLWQPSTQRLLALVNYCTGKQLFNIGEDYEDIFELNDSSGTNIARAMTRQPGVIAIHKDYYGALISEFGQSISWQDLATLHDGGWCPYFSDPRPPHCQLPLYAQTDPALSPTGLDALLAQLYVFSEVTATTEGSSILAWPFGDNALMDVRGFQDMSRHNAQNTRVLSEYLSLGPDYIRFVALDENSVTSFNIENANSGQTLYAVVPEEGVFLQERPFGISLSTTTDSERQAARLFADFVLGKNQQEDLWRAGFRPVNQDAILDPLNSCGVENCGMDMSWDGSYLSPPDPNTIDKTRTIWVGTNEIPAIRRQTQITLMLDLSSSITDLQMADIRDAAVTFIEALEPDTSLRIVGFHSESSTASH